MSDLDPKVFEQSCSICLAEPGKPCRNEAGVWPKHSAHLERVQASKRNYCACGVVRDYANDYGVYVQASGPLISRIRAGDPFHETTMCACRNCFAMYIAIKPAQVPKPPEKGPR